MNTNFTNFFNYAAKEPQNTGGGNSQFLRSESVRSTLAGRRLSNTLITHESPTNHPLKQSVWKYVAMLLMVLTLGVGNVWGAKETIFYLSTKSSGESLAVSHGGSTTISTSDYLSDLTGATSVTLKNKRSGNGSQNMVATDNNEYHLTFTHNDLCIIIELTSKLAAGDEISLTGGSSNKICFTASETRSTTDYATTSAAFTIPENHDLVGKTTLYIWRNSGNTYIKTLTISRTTSGGGGGGGDTTAPTLSSSNPANSATDVAVSGTIVLTFSEEIASVDGSKFSLSGATKGTVAIDGTDATKVNVPYSGAANSATVTLSVAAGAVSDASSNASAALSNISFTTVAGGGGDSPTLDVEFTTQTTSDWLKSYTEGATFAGDGGFGSSSGYYYSGCSGQASSSDGLNKYYFGISAASGKKITKVSLLISPNSTTAAQPVLVGWDETATFTNVALCESKTGTSTSNTKANAEWLTWDLSGDDEINYVRIYRKISGSLFSKDGGTTYISQTGASVTLRIWRVKVWLADASTPTTYTLTASATVINPMTDGGKTGAITATIENSPVTGISSGTTTSTSSNTFTVAKATSVTVTAPATVSGSAAECNECTYRFDSWENIPASVTADVNNIHAKYNTTYGISYTLDGGSWASEYTAPTYYVYGTGLTLPVAANIEKENYTFAGWTFDYDDSDISTIGTTVSGNISVTAHWSAVSAPTHAITYNTESLKGSDVSAYPTEYTEGVGIASFTALADVTNFHFNGWSPASIGTDATEDVEMTATWVAAYNVTFSAGDGGGTVPTTFQKWQGGTFALPEQGSMTAPSLKEFDGWKANGTGDKLAAGYVYTMGNAPVEFVAQWKDVPTNTISLDANGGSIVSYEGWTKDGDVYSKTVESGTAVSLLAFTKEDVQLMFFRDGSANEYSSSVTLNADLSLKAVWGEEKEVELYYWEGKSGGATERGGTAATTDAGEEVNVNYHHQTYYVMRLNDKTYDTGKRIEIALDQNVKTGDVVKITAYCWSSGKTSTIKMADATDSSKELFSDTESVPEISGGGSPAEKTYNITNTGINSSAVQLTRNGGNTNCFITKLVITGTRVVEVLDPAATPTITTQPTGGTYAWDATTTQMVVATVLDGGTLHYQWYKEAGGTDTKVGTDAASYTPTESGTYYVVVTNKKTGFADASATSSNATVTINARPSYKVSYYDGEVKLGEETVYEGESPAHSGDYEERMLAVFDGWYNNADLAEGHKIISVAALEIDDNANIYGKWTKTYAQDIDFVAKIGTDGKTFNYATFLSGKGYLLTQGTGHQNELDNTNAFDTGLKLKNSTGNKLQFRAPTGKLVKVVMGKVNGMSYSVNGATAKSLNGGTDKDHLGVTYMYNAGEQEITLAETATAYNMLKSITMTDAPVVTYNATTNGGSCATENATFTGTALTLPAAEKDGSRFDGWFTTANDETETGTLVGLAGATYTPASSTTLYARFTQTTSLATLTDIKVNGATITGFAADKYEYTIEFPYKTAVVPTIAYTRGYEGEGGSAGEAVTMSPNPITSVTGDVTLHVVSEDETVQQDYVLHFTEAAKDMLCLILLNTPNGNGNAQTVPAANVTGYIGGTAVQKLESGHTKLGSGGHYIGITLANGTFQAGDVVKLYAEGDTKGDYVRIFKSNSASEENELVKGSEAMIFGMNEVTLPANTQTSLWLRRGTNDENYNKSWNPWVKSFGVYRPFPQPLLTGMTIDGAVAVVDELDATVYNVTIPAGSNLASLDVVPTFLSNDPSLTNGAVSGSWAIGSNTYVVTDKDGDSKSYTINITRDAAVESVSVSGEATVAAKSQITLTATVLPAEVSNKAVTWSSSDETKATVDANGVVTGKAEGSVTITATSVADNTKKGTWDITVTKFVGTERAYWFVYADDAAANDVSNNSTVFGSAPTGSNNGGFELTLEEGWTVTTTKKTGSTSSFGTFTVPADFTATWYAAVKAGGNNRVLNMKQGDVVKYSVALTNATDPEIVKIENIAAGTYDVVLTGGSSISGAYLFAAELNSYPLTSVALEEGFNLRLGNSRTPVFTITPAKAAVASQVWSEVSRTGASDATLNTSTGEITAGTEEGTLTVKVSVTDAFGNEVESGNCVVKIVNIIDQKDVTGSMTWNWTGAATASVTIDNEEALVLGNYIDGDQWAYLKGTNGDQAYHHESSYGSYQGKGTLSFKTTVPGLVTITARRWSNTPDLKIGEDVILSLESSNKTSKAYFVPAGEVNIIADATDGMRILKIEFDAEPTVDKIEGSHFGGYEREVNPQYYGTVCLPKAGVMVGAMLFQVAYMDYKEDNTTPNKVYYDQVENGIMQAGMPYIFLAEQSTIGVYYTGTTEVTAGNELDYHGLHGTLTDITEGMNATGIYMLYNNQVLHSTNPASYLNANRAYLQISEIPGFNDPDYVAPAPTRRRIATGFNGENVATGLENLNASDKPMKLMINGQIFIIRGEKMFDTTGRLVK